MNADEVAKLSAAGERVAEQWHDLVLDGEVPDRIDLAMAFGELASILHTLNYMAFTEALKPDTSDFPF